MNRFVVPVFLVSTALLASGCGQVFPGNGGEWETLSSGRSSSGSAARSLEKAKAGDFITYGSYIQTPASDGGRQDLEWIVLDRQPEKVLLLTRYVIALAPFHETGEPVTWADSSLREMLNGDFYEDAFLPEEKSRILTASNSTTANPDRGTSGGAETDDYVFLLCQEDAAYYMDSDYTQWEFGSAQPTEAAKQEGVYVDEETGCSPWWLRSPGYDEYSIMFMQPDGTPYIPGANADIDYYYGVRPAIWVSIRS